MKAKCGLKSLERQIQYDKKMKWVKWYSYRRRGCW